ncbi:hypothetical protein GCM10022244_38830 [Streptomyces gulbargensis]|uniref:Secreted protein n=1 Tax=Streptomyces gulbargensis TaxID=364901 RepID=A0ABP7MLI2_9ACTN
MVKLSFGVAAGAGALVALVVAYRRQRVDEGGLPGAAHGGQARASPEPFHMPTKGSRRDSSRSSVIENARATACKVLYSS